MIDIERVKTFPVLVELGKLQITTEAKAELPEQDAYNAVLRHCRGDWGEAPERLRLKNEINLKAGKELASRFTSKGKTFWVLTIPELSETTIALEAQKLKDFFQIKYF